jgi:hypothetical protein
MAIIAKIKDEAARITAECPDPEQQTAANIMYSFGHYLFHSLLDNDYPPGFEKKKK